MGVTVRIIDQAKAKALNEISGCARTPLQQDWRYGAAMAAQGITRFCVLCESHDHKPVAWLQVYKRRIGGLVPIAFIQRGICWLVPDSHRDAARERQAKYALIDEIQSAIAPRIVWLSEVAVARTPDDTLAGEDICDGDLPKRARQVATGDSTVWLDLSSDEAALRARLNGKWRNGLKRAEAADIDVQAFQNWNHQADALLKREAAQQRIKRYSALPTTLARGFHEASVVTRTPSCLLVQAVQTGAKTDAPLASALFLIHGQSATYHIGWSSDAGRAQNAQNLVLWRTLGELKALGVTTLDLGGVNTRTAPGLARFKLGMGGMPVTYAGTYFISGRPRL